MTIAVRRPDDRSESALIGQSEAMQRLRARIAQVARMHVPVLIIGPTGAGKELVARALHGASGRQGEFVAVNVGAIADTIFEDSFFGHVRGAFTNATGNKLGHLAEADAGTLFLDEIGDLSFPNQVKLLRALDLGYFRPLGAERDRRSNFRTLAATNADIEGLVRQQRFREDLYHRLGAAVLRVPALADRPEDIPELVHYFARSVSLTHKLEVSPQAVAMLQAHTWPGNVRELRHVVEYATGLAEEYGCLSAWDVGVALHDHGTSDRAMRGDSVAMSPELRSYSVDAAALRRHLALVIHEERGSIPETARRLGVSQGTIYRWLRRLGLPTPRYVRSKSDRNAPRQSRCGAAEDASPAGEPRRPPAD
ncbi:MAG TPA: sigma-54 dependent transcriptional regulator [Gemmatimonadaceae bacterium]|nr:sigma-54 dependent transcriptional regulator [Gemmatimonadaceae bacterium]